MGDNQELLVHYCISRRIRVHYPGSRCDIKKYSVHSEVASTRIMGTRILHDKFLHTKIKHLEVEELFQYVKANPESESVRNEFFKVLENSEDAGRTTDYLNPDIVREALQDAKYNPFMDSGIPEIDLYQDWLDEALTVRTPYVRANKKTGRNEPCPCGSGKKFKHCCLGKGIYD